MENTDKQPKIPSGGGVLNDKEDIIDELEINLGLGRGSNANSE